MPSINEMFPSKYLKAEDIGDREVPVTIRKVVNETVKSRDGSENRWVVYFDGKKKGWILNVTNGKAIAAIAKRPNSKDWTGVDIVLYTTMVSFGSDSVLGIRVKVPNGSAETTDTETEAESMASDDIPF
jgi:CRISPR/Cas system-associated protein Cas5 (RAMP superfamily)